MRSSCSTSEASSASPAGRERLEPFFTTKDPATGTGLGLSIVYGIAKEAGGAVTFTSPPGQGATFEVLLLLAEAGGSP